MIHSHLSERYIEPGSITVLVLTSNYDCQVLQVCVNNTIENNYIDLCLYQ